MDFLRHLPFSCDVPTLLTLVSACTLEIGSQCIGGLLSYQVGLRCKKLEQLS